MKGLIMCVAGAMMALSLAACSPTKLEPEQKPEAAQVSPEGLDPAIIQQRNEEQVDPKLMPPDPNAPVMDSAIIYYGKEDGSGLVREMVDVDELTAEAVVDKLIEYGVLEEGTAVNSFDIEGGEKAGPGVDASEAGNGERIGTLDLSGLGELEGADEKIVLHSIANTFVESFELDKVELLADGAPYSSDLLVDGYLESIDDYEKLN